MKKLLSIIVTLTLFVALAAGQAGAVVWGMPSGNATGPTGYNNSNIQGQMASGGMNIVGSIITAGIGTPSAPTMTTNGTAGATSIVYACTAFDYNGAQTIPSATATLTTGNATLSATNSVNVTCGGQRGAMGYLINKVDTSHIIGYCYTTSNTSCTFVDTGTYQNGTGGATQTSSFTYTPNTVDQTNGASSASGSVSHTVWQGTTNAVVSTSVETFWSVLGSSTGFVAATVGDGTTVITGPATIKNLNCGSYTILGAAVAAGGTSITYALGTGAPGVAPTDSALTCVEATAATTCADTTHVIQLAAGSNVYFSATPAGTPTASVTKCSADVYQ